MIRFDKALAALLDVTVEGLYDNDPDDAGGETVRGIARKFNPTWPGWPVVDQLKADAPNHAAFLKALEQSALVSRMVAVFYLDTYWVPLNCEALPTPIGEKLFEVAVNTNEQTAVKLLQIALAAMNHSEVLVDGKLGPTTIAAAGREVPAELYDSFQAAHGGFYVGRRNPKFERGWIRRALANDDGG